MNEWPTEEISPVENEVEEVKPELEKNSDQVDFSDILSKKETINTPTSGPMEIVDISPENKKDEVPVLLAPAWACDIATYAPGIQALLDRGRRVLSLEHPRKGGIDLKDCPPITIKGVGIEKFPEEQLRKAMNIIALLEEKGTEKVDIIAHSEGALNATIAAMLHPERIRNIVYYGPAGLIGEDNFVRLAKGFSKQGERPKSISEIPQTENERYVGKAAGESVKKYALSNPIRAIKETVSISASQIHEMLRYLHKEEGIGIVVLSGVDDPVFSNEKMEEKVDPDMADAFFTLPGGHGTIGEQQKHMAFAEQMLESMKEQQQVEKEN